MDKCEQMISVCIFYFAKGGVTVSKKLNERQKKFAEYYAQSGNATESARKAGYSEKFCNTNASKTLQNTTVQEYIKALSEKTRNDRILTACERQEILSDIAKDGSEDAQARIKAIDTLNKMTGEYTLKVDTTVKTSEKLDDVISQLNGEGLKE